MTTLGTATTLELLRENTLVKTLYLWIAAPEAGPFGTVVAIVHHPEVAREYLPGEGCLGQEYTYAGLVLGLGFKGAALCVVHIH